MIDFLVSYVAFACAVETQFSHVEKPLPIVARHMASQIGEDILILSHQENMHALLAHSEIGAGRPVPMYRHP